ncbi:MAG: MBL fold metallo-hydrolase, partial [Fenollaria timonensis]
MKDILKFCSLSSGSCGNANYIEYKDTKVLKDAGLNGVTTDNALKEIGTDIKDLDADILTHEHRDNVQGAGLL